jgi:hypothetical protein
MHLAWQFVGGLLSPMLHAIGKLLPGTDLLASWGSWYADNQFKFTFWLFYSAAICDGLGVPNYKTLGRMLWQRCVRRWNRVGRGGAGPEI